MIFSKKLLFVIDNRKPEYVHALTYLAYTALYRLIDSSVTAIDKDLMQRTYRTNIKVYEKVRNLYSIVPYDEIGKQPKEAFEEYCGIVALGAKSRAVCFKETLPYKTTTKTVQGLDGFYLYSAFDLHYVYSNISFADNAIECDSLIADLFRFFLKCNNLDVYSSKTIVNFVYTAQELRAAADIIKKHGVIAFDFETKPKKEGLEKVKDIKDHSVNFFLSDPTVLSISYQPQHSYLIPIYHYQSPTRLKKSDTIEFEDSGENGKKFLYLNGTPVKNYKGDTSVLDEDLCDRWKQIHNELQNQHNDKDTYFDIFLLPLVKEIFEDNKIEKVAHNAKFDYKLMRQLGSEIKGIMHDTLILNHTLWELGSNGLKDISGVYFPEFNGYGENIDYANETLHDLGIYAGADTDLTLRLFFILYMKVADIHELHRVYRSLEIPKLAVLARMEYEGMQLDSTRLYTYIKEVTKLSEELHNAIQAHPVIQRYILAVNKEKKEEAIKIARDKLVEKKNKCIESLQKKIDNPKTSDNMRVKHEAEMHLMLTDQYYHPDYPYKSVVTAKEKVMDITTGTVYSEINLNSPQQLQGFIYDSPHGLKHKRPVVKRKVRNERTKRYMSVVEPYPSTDKNDLADLKDTTGILEKIVEYKAITKLLNTYLLGMEKVSDSNFRVHTRYSTVKSQRLGSSNPNLQNIPSRSNIESVAKVVKMIKKCFIPKKGWVMAQIDLSQAELRVFASLGEVRSMVEAYIKKLDLHVMTAATIKGMSYEEFKSLPEDEYKMGRYNAKAINFGAIYKISAKGLQEFAKKGYGVVMGIDEAEVVLNNFLNGYPEIRAYHESQIEIAHRYKYVTTGFGSRRNLPDLNSSNTEYRAKDERISINSPTQGTVGQMIIFTLFYLKDRLNARGFEGMYRIMNTVHDSIIIEADPKIAQEAFKIAVESCNNPPMREYFNFELHCPMQSDIEVSTDSWAMLTEVQDLDMLNDLIDKGEI